MYVVVLKYNCPSPILDAGDVVAAALPNLKYLREVTVREMNPMPVLQSVGLCGKLQEVSVWHPKHCEVGMRCAYTDGWRLCVHAMCLTLLWKWIRQCDYKKWYHEIFYIRTSRNVLKYADSTYNVYRIAGKFREV